MNKDIINVHIGQAGVQMGQSLWQTYNQQFGINFEGKKIQQKHQRVKQQHQLNKHTLYRQSCKNTYTPRVLFYDSDPYTIDEIKKSMKYVSPNQMLSAKYNDAIYSNALYQNKEKLVQFFDRIRIQVQKSDCLEGFMIHHAVGGGTGSGANQQISELLCANYHKKSKFNFTIFPSTNYSNTILENYNAVLGLYSLIKHSDIVFPINNEQLYNICTNQLDIDSPYFKDINKLISQICSNITLPMCKLQSRNNINFQEIQTNLVPYPDIHFISASYAPYLSHDSMHTDKVNLQYITQAAFNRENYIVDINPAYGKYYANYLLYRGNVSEGQAVKQTNKIKKTRLYKQVDYIHTGMKIQILNKVRNAFLPYYNDQQLCLLSNSKSIQYLFCRIDHKFDLMFANRSFAFRYVNYMQEGFFYEARQEISQLELNYSGGFIQSAQACQQ